MDNSAALEAKRAALIDWWNQNPITLELRARLQEKDKALQELILNSQPESVKDQVIREQAIGSLRGLRTLQEIVTDAIADLTQEIETT